MATLPSAGPTSPPQVSRLSGWKEIAAHFGKGVRTVQRWERELGLPVRRIGTGRAETVYALVDELDRWQESAEKGADLSSRGGEEDAPESQAPEPRIPGLRRSKPLAIVGVAVLALAIGAAMLMWLAGRQTPGSRGPGSSAAAAPVPARYKVDIDTLRVYDVDGREIWSRQFESRLRPALYDVPLDSAQSLVRILDVDRDGRREVVMLAAGAAWSRYYCFEGSTGAVRVEYQPTRTVRFGQRDYAPPWEGFRLSVTGEPSTPRIWTVWIDGTSGYFPTLVQEMTPHGPSRDEYWHAGFIEVVAAATIGGRPVILIGGANNDRQTAGLSVLDANAVRGSGPAVLDDKTCHTCPSGRPLAYLTFPTLEALPHDGGRASVVGMTQDSHGMLSVVVEQGTRVPGDRDVSDACVCYKLDSQLTLIEADFGDQFPPLHRRLEQAGLIRHPFGARDRVQLLDVKSWDGQRFVSLRIGERARIAIP